VKKAILTIAIAVTVVYSLAPFLWFVLASWKTPAQLTTIPPVVVPAFHWGFYNSALTTYGLLGYIRNSVIVAAATTAVSIAIGALAAYALTRFHSHWLRFYLIALLCVSMFPQIAVAGPVWRILDALGWLNSFPGIIVAYISFSLPLAIWILATFFKELPYEIEEAALIDGCSRLGALRRIVLPLAAPAIFTAALLVFIYAWNEFFFALIILTSPALQTLPVGIALFPGEYTMPWGELAAASTVATLPLIALTLFFQRRIIGGLSAGAVKG
jgi:multiple sugar transport system permease protein